MTGSDTAGPRGGDVPDKPSLLPGPALLPVTSPPWACPPLSCQAPATGKAQGAPSVRSLRRPGLLGPDARRSVGSKKIRCSAAPLNGWHRSPVCTSDPGHTWPGRHWRSSSCDWPSGPEQSRLWASRTRVCAPRALAHGADGGRSSGSDRNSSRSKPDQRDRQRLSNPGPRSARATLRHRRGQVANLV